MLNCTNCPLNKKKEPKKSMNIIEHMRNYECSKWIYIEWVLLLLLFCCSIGLFIFWLGYSLLHYNTDNPATILFHIRSWIIIILSSAALFYIGSGKDWTDDDA